ncbi:MAG: hypothetical protein KatS3mg057_2797 [Herpetosiphonaceae bacterium]|nr:MAG: hypothetical protein KatS3mg057_2797 [Herpetosiphonaceae bacterium]
MSFLNRLGRLWTILLVALVALALITLAALLILMRLDIFSRPVVRSIEPEPDTSDVPIFTPLVIRFNEPMNQRSVERAFEIDPPAEFQWRWLDDGATVVLSPTAPLQPGITYTLQLDSSARSRLLRPIKAPVSSQFRTAPAPAARFIWPPPGGSMPPDGALVIQFSQPIVSDRDLPQPYPLDIRLEPAVDLTTLWVDASTVLVRPLGLLRPGQIYTATISSLVDRVGTPLSQPLRWSFLVQPPLLVAVSPRPAEQIPPSEPLVLSFASPVDPAQIRDGLIMTPSVDLQVVDQITPATTVTLTAGQPLTAGLRYTATLALGQAEPFQWSFLVRDIPEVLASVPGAGQAIAPDEEIRLFFSSQPGEELLQQALSLSPAVASLSTVVEGRELRIRGEFQPATAYTLTLQTPSSQQPFVLHFHTLGELPSLQVEEPEEPLSIWPFGARPQILLRWAEVPPPAYELFALDRPLLLQALADPERAVDPQRFDLAPLRTWSTAAGDGQERMTLADQAGQPLAPGAYLLRVSAGSLQAQRILIISRYHLMLSGSARDVVVWAIRQSDGGAAPGLPLLILSGDTPLATAQTNAVGLWQTTLSTAPGRLVVFGGDVHDPAVAIGEVRPATTSRPSAQLLIDRPHYRPGDTVQLVGAGLSPDTTFDLRLKDTFEIWTARTDAHGVISATLPLPIDLAPGRYALRLSSGIQTWDEIPLVVVPPDDATTALSLRISDTLVVAGAPFTAGSVARSGALPLLDVPIHWQLNKVLTDGVSLEPELAGTVRTDVTGHAEISFPAPNTLHPATYILQASVPGRAAAVPLVVAPGLMLTAAPAAQLVQAREQTELLITARHADGTPASDVVVQVGLDVERLQQGSVQSNSLRTLRATTDEAGQALITWTPPSAGRYRLRASAGDGLAHAEAMVWATAPGSHNWPEVGQEQLVLIADQTSYAPGAVAHILPLITASKSLTTLVLLHSPVGLTTQLESLAPGEPLSVTLPLTGPVRGEVFLVEQAGGSGQELPRLRHGELHLSVAAPEEALHLSVDVTPRQPQPGELATFTLSLMDGQGRPISGTVALALHEALGASATLSASLPFDLQRWAPAIRIGPGGKTSLTVRLPNRSAVWELRALAIGAGRQTGAPATASLLVAVNKPIDQRLILPSFIRVGDMMTGTVVLESVDPVSVTLAAPEIAGVRMGPLQPSAIHLPEGGRARSEWRLDVLDEGQVYVRVLARQEHLLSTTSAVTVEDILLPMGVGSLGLIQPGSTERITLPALAGEGRLVVMTSPRLEELVEPGWEQLLNRPRDDLFALVAALLAPGELTTERENAAMQLLALQNGDGGWGWWRAGASDPLATDLVIRALRLGTHARDADVAAALDRAAIFLRARLVRAGDPDMSALLLASLAELGAGDLDAIRELLARESSLTRSSRAMLALALARLGEPDQARLQLRRLLSASADAGTGRQESVVPYSAVREQALVLLALDQLDPTSPRREDWLGLLLSQYSGYGWGTAYETTLALIALRELPQARLPASDGPRSTIRLDDRLLLEGAGAQHISQPLDELSVSRTLTIAASGGPLAYAWWIEVDRMAPGQQSLILREYLDPRTGAPLEDGSLQRGSELLVRLTIIAREPLALVQLRDPLPPGALLSGQIDGFLQHSGLVDSALAVWTPGLAPGVHQVSFRLQLTIPGHFTIPAPNLTALGGIEALGVPTTLIVNP